MQGNVEQGPECREQPYARAIFDGFPFVAQPSASHDRNISWYVRRLTPACRGSKTDNVFTAQCLYVLTDDNPPVGDEIRANLSHISCLLEVSKVRSAHDIKGKTPAAEERAVALGILGCGAQTL